MEQVSGWGRHHGECGARAYNGGLGAEPPARSRGRAPGQGGKAPPEAESILVIGCPTEPATLAPFQKCLALQGMNCLTVDLSALRKTMQCEQLKHNLDNISSQKWGGARHIGEPHDHKSGGA